MNRFARLVFRRMKVDADRPVQDAHFIGSYTSLRREGGEDEQCGRILGELGIDPGTFVAVPVPPDEEADQIFILRHTLMNPFPYGWTGRTQIHRHVLGFSGGGHRRGSGRVITDANSNRYGLDNKRQTMRRLLVVAPMFSRHVTRAKFSRGAAEEFDKAGQEIGRLGAGWAQQRGRRSVRPVVIERCQGGRGSILGRSSKSGG